MVKILDLFDALRLAGGAILFDYLEGAAAT
jgi:hypothetical protein